ncbi:MAG: hypothetical protein AAF501_10555 [Pseudomonadota bacterium]
MTTDSDKDIVAKADPDPPEVLDGAALDQATGGALYGSSNSCEPVDPVPTEEISLSYERVEWSYSEVKGQKPGGLKSR